MPPRELNRLDIKNREPMPPALQERLIEADWRDAAAFRREDRRSALKAVRPAKGAAASEPS